MKTITSSFVLATALVAITSGIASARTVGVSTGHNVYSVANEDNCMRNEYANGGIKNNCSTAQLWGVDLVVDPGGSKTMQVSGYVNSSTYCIGRGLDMYGNVYGQTNWTYFPSGSPSYRNLQLTGTAYVPSGGMLQLQCWIAPGQTLSVVNNLNG